MRNELVLLRLYSRMVCNCNVESNNHIHTCGGCGMALLYDNPNLCHALYSCWSNYYGKNMMLGTPVRSYKSFLVFRQIRFVFFVFPSIKSILEDNDLCKEFYNAINYDYNNLFKLCIFSKTNFQYSKFISSNFNNFQFKCSHKISETLKK